MTRARCTGEGNSVACGGAEGVSDVFGAALWALDAVFYAASLGVSRWNFHGGPAGAYTAIAYKSRASSVPDVRPLYYAIWAVATAVAGDARLMNASVVSSNPGVRAWALRAAGGTWRVVLLHKDSNATAPASVVVRPAAACGSTASVTRLTAGGGGITAKYGISFGGQTFDGSADGTPQGTHVAESVPSVGGAWSFALPPGSGAVLEFSE